MNKLERTFKEQNYDVPKWYRWPMDAAGVIGSYGLLPEGIYETVPRAMAFSAADAYQSGINKDVKDRAVNSIVSALTAGALTKVANKITGKDALNKATKEYPLLTEGFKNYARCNNTLLSNDMDEYEIILDKINGEKVYEWLNLK